EEIIGLYKLGRIDRDLFERLGAKESETLQAGMPRPSAVDRGVGAAQRGSTEAVSAILAAQRRERDVAAQRNPVTDAVQQIARKMQEVIDEVRRFDRGEPAVAVPYG